uniref:Uncharacterized protein n=1 Tax=viral metagenome TaxID=1070528 RepID=A0A6H1ZDA1_9ZZZZ
MEAINTKIYENLTPSQWEEKIFYRGVNVKYPQQLKYLIDEMYPAKVIKLKERLKVGKLDIEEVQYLNSKILRLTEKYAVCKKMYDLRIAKTVPTTGKWAMHGTVYYIDSDRADDTGNGLTPATAWKTINKYTTVTVCSPGDIAYVRANKTYLNNAADIIFDEDGTANAYIELRGCSVADDPWGDASDVKPIIDFGDAQYQILLSDDDYWKLANLDIIQSADILGNIQVSTVNGLYLLNCIIRDNSAATGKYGMRCALLYNFKIENCQFSDNLIHSFSSIRSSGIFDNCIFNSGITTTACGLYGGFGSTLVAKNCSFGQTTSHVSEDIIAEYVSFIHTINCKRNKSTYSATLGSVVFAEDDNQVKGANVTYSWLGTVTKSATVTDGALSSAQLLPNSSCGLYAPLSVTPFNDYDFKIPCSAALTTLTIKIKADSAWAVYPTAAQLYMETSYLSHATAATRATIASTQVLADGTTWVAFTNTFTPLQAGFAYVKVYLGLYTATEGVLVNMQVVKT